MGVLNNIQKNANKAIRPLCERLGYNKPIYSPSIPHLFPIYSPSIPHLFPIYSPSPFMERGGADRPG